jgi:hypothetical protein
MKYLVLDNKRYLWRDILKLRREQRKLARNAQQALFELHDDQRPKSQSTASSRSLNNKQSHLNVGLSFLI